MKDVLGALDRSFSQPLGGDDAHVGFKCKEKSEEEIYVVKFAHENIFRSCFNDKIL
jgi:hypothetical protein